MPDLGDNDPLSVAVRGRGSLYALDTATQPGQGALDIRPQNSPADPLDELERRRQYLIQQLPSANKRSAYQINSELRALNASFRQSQYEAHQMDEQRRWEANQRRLMAHDQAEMAAQALKLDRETAIDEQGSSLMTGLGRLDAMHRNGRINDEQFDDGILDLGQRYNLGMRHPVAGKMFEHYVTEADKRNAFNIRRITSESAKIAGRYGIEPRIDPETGLPSIELTKAAALHTPKGVGEALTQMNQEMLQKYGIGTGVSSLFNPVVPHTDTGDGKGINLPFVDKAGKAGSIAVPKPVFNQMKADFQDRYFSIVPQQQPNTDPRLELAQRALSDPNASAEHKAAARRILGIQENAQ